MSTASGMPLLGAVAVLCCVMAGEPAQASVDAYQSDRPDDARLADTAHYRDFEAGLFDICVPVAGGTPITETAGYEAFGRPEAVEDHFATKSDVGISIGDGACYIGSEHNWEAGPDALTLLEDRLGDYGWVKLSVPQPFAGSVYLSADYRLRVDFLRDSALSVQAFTSPPEAVRDHFAAMAIANARPLGEALSAVAAACSEAIENAQREWRDFQRPGEEYRPPRVEPDDDIPRLNRVIIRIDNGSPILLGQVSPRVDVTPAGCQFVIWEFEAAARQALRADVEQTLSDPRNGWTRSSDILWRNSDGTTLTEMQGDDAWDLQYLAVPPDLAQFHAFFEDRARYEAQQQAWADQRE